MFECRFADMAVLVTGGASGAGTASAYRLVKEEARVSLWDINRNSLQAANELTCATHLLEVDVSDPEAVIA